VQGELEQALLEFFGTETTSIFAGRTDRGVHAAGQVVSIIDRRLDLAASQIQKALNVRLPDDLAVVQVQRKPGEFHARYDAKWREYRYRLWIGPPQPLMTTVVARTSRRMCLEAMAEAAAKLSGTRDLASFAGDGEGVPWSKRHESPKGTVRSISHCSVRLMQPWWTGTTGDSELLEIRVVADGFLPKMVRNIVGGLMEIGSRKKAPKWFDELLVGRDRRHAGMTAPAHGLTLWRVGYNGESPDDDRPEPDLGALTV